ncbi:hypothetical protein pclt_cds_1184 [Pandoravirus celtis]|uniref:Uncharacterized protein n=1 Tax=Pandoravirus celtis TaxID=2568002 RepID=A0A4D6EKL9_9VIRU|nr:hypothetical protein pclt_cds_1184 [Pandoravirus celtis]
MARRVPMGKRAARPHRKGAHAAAQGKKGCDANPHTQENPRLRGRSSISVDQCASYLDAAAARIEAGGAIPANCRHRCLCLWAINHRRPSAAIGERQAQTSLSRRWLPALKAHLKKPRMAPCSEADHGGPPQSSPLPSTNFSCRR